MDAAAGLQNTSTFRIIDFTRQTIKLDYYSARSVSLNCHSKQRSHWTLHPCGKELEWFCEICGNHENNADRAEQKAVKSVNAEFLRYTKIFCII